MSRKGCDEWINGCTQWIYEEACAGNLLYSVNFMFVPLAGSRQAIIMQMHRAVERFYGRFCTEFTRDPLAPSQQHKLPKLWLIADLPTWKKAKKHRLREVQFNDGGLHLNGFLSLPPVSDFEECPIAHLREHKARYLSRAIEEIYVGPITSSVPEIVDYSLKTYKRGRTGSDDILVLPKGRSELRHAEMPVMGRHARLVKDLQSRYNISAECAEQMLSASDPSAASF